MKRTCLVAVVGLLASGGWGTCIARAGLPSNEEQYWLELINRMRTHPAAELGRLVNIVSGSKPGTATWGNPASVDPDVADALRYFNVSPSILQAQWGLLTAAQPLAWNNNLHTAAVGHNAKMIAYDEQSHQLPGELGLMERLNAAGYQGKTSTSGGENIYAYSYSVLYGHAGFAIDWGEGTGGMQDPAGHRKNLMNATFKEAGISITLQNDSSKETGPLVVTQDFGVRDLDSKTNKATYSFITGVIYTDAVQQDRFYTPGEGLSGVTVEVRRPGSGTLVAAGVTYASGGYSVRVADGTYDVVISGGDLGEGMTYRNVVVANNNVKLDSLSSWSGGVTTNWTDTANWYGGVPNGVGTVATFGAEGKGKPYVQVNGPVTTGTIVLEGAQRYMIEGTNTLTLQATAGPAALWVYDNASHRIGAALAMNSDTEIAVDEEATLVLAGPISIGDGKVVSRSGTGLVEITGAQSHGAGSEFVAAGGVTNFASDSGSRAVRNLGIRVGSAGFVNFQASQHLRRLSVNGGSVAITRGADKIVLTDELSIDGSGLLDVNDNSLIVKASASTREAVLGQVTGWIKSARGTNGQWEGSGITSSVAGENHLTGLAVVLNDKGGGKGSLFTQFNGEDVDVNSILVKYTWNGDVTLDGKVDIADYFLVDSGFISQKGGYRNGDLNFDGKVDIADYFLIDSAFIGQTGVLGGMGGVWTAAVPEPGCVGIMIGVLGGVMMRRGKR
ncbi:MAG TPA: CAP domain-containing protein [Tepidisphaeraceae bacterium]|nr:CAP domain-containing protein [Tepidisphaeraceae bacterium]